MAAGVACPTCGTNLRADAKFCDECGAALYPADKPAEYKQVTVLFADVVHSMDIAAALGPERLRELMSELLDRFTFVVQRYGGTVNQFTGDGIMTVFGAPISLEDHAIRACLAALDIQRQTADFAVGVQGRDGIDVQLRVGLNSGEVIAGDVGSRLHSYAPVGEPVGMAQRMESIAPPGGVMISESTARLVANHATLSERRVVRIKGVDVPVPVYELLAVIGRHTETTARTSRFVGREWELAALSAMVDRAADGHGCVAAVVGPPGIGKSRMVAETAALAARRGAQVCSAYCESHTSDVPFQFGARLFRSTWGVDGLDDEAAREVTRRRVPDGHADDVVLLYDQLGIRAEPLPDIAPDARRRRLIALVNASMVARRKPALFIFEDVHWIDPMSESLLAEFLPIIPRTNVLVLITYRPEYAGPLSRVPGAQAISLGPLDDAQMTGLVAELLGADPSVTALSNRVTERASGNPFFAEEMVRDLADRGVLCGARGAYTCVDDATEVDVPATLQAVIAARIDRLETSVKFTLNAAAVIGMRFDEAMLAALVDEPNVEPLVEAELVDQVTFTARPEYAFRHPSIRTVAYRSQLKSTRAQLHRRLADALQASDPQSLDENAALIAEHLEATGELPEAFGWHMRAGGWLTFRDIAAARLCWQRARQVADRLPAEDTRRQSMRIAPRALLCATAFRVGGAVDEDGFDELRRLTGMAGDKMSLAVAMAGHVMSLVFHARYRESSQLASELTDLVDSLNDAGLAVGLLTEVVSAKLANGEIVDALRLAQRVIDLTGGDSHLGDFVIESPLTVAAVFRATARMCLGASGWKSEMVEATEMCGERVPLGQAVMLFWRYGYGISAGAFRPDAAAVRKTAEVLELARRTGDNLSLDAGRFLHGYVLVKHDGPDRDRGLDLLAAAREAAIAGRSPAVIVPLADIEFARETARTGDLDEAIRLLGTVIDHTAAAGGQSSHGAAVEALVELLLQRGGLDDVQAAQAAIEQLAGEPTDAGFVVYDLILLRLRALLARAQGDDVAYRDYRDRHRDRADELGFEGHIDMASALAIQRQ